MSPVGNNLGEDSHQRTLERRASLVDYRGFHSIHRVSTTGGHLEVANPEALEGVQLGATQRPCICSEADVKRGYVGGRQRLWGESQLHRRPACLRRRCHPHQAQLDWIPTASRCSST